MKHYLILSILVLNNSIYSCAFVEKRRSHFGYLEVGKTKKDEIIKTSGDPDLKRLENGKELYVYEYCTASWTRTAVSTILSFGILGFSFCPTKPMSNVRIELKDDILIHYDETTSNAAQVREVK